MPSFIDKDAANELGMSYHLRVEYRPPVEGLSVSAFVGMTQAFYAVEDESPLLMDDLFVSAGYWHGVSLAEAGWDRELRFYHRLRAYLPTSRASQNQSLYIAPEWLSAARLEVVDGLTVGVNLSAEYDFHRYAERAGLEGPLNTRLFLGGGVVAQYQLFNHPRWGSMMALAGAGLRYFLLYPSSEEFESETSDQHLWKQDYAWSVGMSYSPVRYVSLEVSLAQNYFDVRRNGVRQAMNQYTAQDQIQWLFSLWGRY